MKKLFETPELIVILFDEDIDTIGDSGFDDAGDESGMIHNP